MWLYLPLESASIPEPTHTQENCFVVGTSEQVNPILRSLGYNHSDGLAKLYARAERQSIKVPDAIPYADPIYWAAFVMTGY